ncbi:MAG: aminotransferase class IV, partial [Pirellulales bacterium]|nr:aminotransferase class IV [Pirellulales bacterium]
MRLGARLVTSSIRQVPPECIPSGMKHRSRMHYYLAAREARSTDAEAVPLLVDLQGNVAETNTANILIVEHGTIVSPPLRNSLPGISREMIIELAAKLDLPFVERAFDVSAVQRANEALLASTPYCIISAVEIDGRAIGDGRPGPVFRRLIDAWSEAVGLDVYRQVVGPGD